MACDPESAAGNSSGSFEELFRSFGTLGRGQPSEGWSEGLSELSPLSSRRPVRVAIMIQRRASLRALWERRDSNPLGADLRLQLGRGPDTELVDFVACYPYRPTLPWWRAGPRLSNKLYIVFKTPACSPVHVSLVSVIVAVVADLSGSVASAACRLQVRVASGASAVWAHDRLRLVVVDEF